jgi:uncharacterized coiled-coil protein SlyX
MNSTTLTEQQKQANKLEAQLKILLFKIEYIMNGGNQNASSKNV